MKSDKGMGLYKRNNKTECKTFKGSITVEAAFVMPIVILSIFALIYLSFYLHDNCLIQGTMDLTLHKAGMTVKHEADISTGEVSYERISDRGVFYLLFGETEQEEKLIQTYLEQELSKGLFITKIYGIKVSVTKAKIKISIETNTKVSLPGLSYLFDPFADRAFVGEYTIHNPTETIRGMEVILETGSSIKGVDKLKEIVEGMLGSKD